ncbi:Clp protease N-terminal domain-containing protein, partial [Bordetella bronchiseptica]
MSDIGRAELFGKLDSLSYRALEDATALCKLRGNPYVELAHWVHAIAHAQDSDLHHIARAFELDLGALQQDLVRALDQLPRGAGAVSDLSEHVDHVVERAWALASLRYGAARIRSGHLLLALLRDPSLRGVLAGMSGQFARVVPDLLLQGLPEMTRGSPEARADAAVADAPPDGG